MMMSSTGRSRRTAITLVYNGWWVGAIFWLLERRGSLVRFHAAQAIAAFGLIALLVVLFSGLAAASLSFLPSIFTLFITAAAVTWTAGIVLWGLTMWKTASGDDWRIPVAARLAERLLKV